jgi:hypothetical protein
MLMQSQWIPAVLTSLFGLDDSEKEKASIFVEDLCFIQTMHWVCDTEVFVHKQLWVRMSALLILAGCTATRPRALVRKKALLYKDIQFQVFSPLSGEQLLTVAITLNLKHIKRSDRKSQR